MDVNLEHLSDEIEKIDRQRLDLFFVNRDILQRQDVRIRFITPGNIIDMEGIKGKEPDQEYEFSGDEWESLRNAVQPIIARLLDERKQRLEKLKNFKAQAEDMLKEL